jgi:hypothetical protein
MNAWMPLFGHGNASMLPHASTVRQSTMQSDAPLRLLDDFDEWREQRGYDQNTHPITCHARSDMK